MVIAAIEHIVISPEHCHGAPHIAGTRIRVQDIVMFRRNGWSAEDMTAQFEELRLAQVFAALAYYYDHQEEIDSAIVRDDQIARESGSQHLQSLMARREG